MKTAPSPDIAILSKNRQLGECEYVEFFDINTQLA
jgi:hypothetical protein